MICGADCADRPRIRNQRGEYACKACVSARKAGTKPADARIGQELLDENRNSSHPPVRAQHPVRDTDADLASALTAAASIEASTNAGEPAFRVMKDCPVCGAVVKDEQVICLSCGADIARGKKSRVRVFERADNEPPAKPNALRLAISVSLAVVGAGIGVGIWIAAASATGESLRPFVFLVGACSGGLALIPLLGNGSRIGGVACAAAALGACAVGLNATPADANEPFEWATGSRVGGGDVAHGVEPLDESQRSVFALVWAGLGAVTAFAIGSSSPYDPEDWDDEEGGA